MEGAAAEEEIFHQREFDAALVAELAWEVWEDVWVDVENKDLLIIDFASENDLALKSVGLSGCAVDEVVADESELERGRLDECRGGGHVESTGWRAGAVVRWKVGFATEARGKFCGNDLLCGAEVDGVPSSRFV